MGIQGVVELVNSRIFVIELVEPALWIGFGGSAKLGSCSVFPYLITCKNSGLWDL